MSGMVLGSMIEADHRLRDYEARVRIQRKMAIDRATWERYEKLYDEPASVSKEPAKRKE